MLADYIILKKYVLVLLLLSTWTYGQFESVGFSGFIQTNDSVTFPYEINITRLGNVINGYSISDKGGTSETKTTFEVKTIRDRIYFKEQEVVYTKADYSTFDDFCLVTFNLNEKELFTAKILTLISWVFLPMELLVSTVPSNWFQKISLKKGLPKQKK